ncbi:DMT family transporter [Paenibacillus sp. y28]|uniref:DMT family transporter n=1 Tax=Paenibacillus sp. y28 TaxID=3129110 RepID=UPI003019FA10
MNNYKVVLFLLLANLFWAGNYILGKYVVAELTPLQMTFCRWLIAIFLLFPIAHWVERPVWRDVWKRWKTLIVLAVLGIVSYNFLLYEALRFTTSMNAALVNAMNPAVIVIFSALLLKESISRMKVLGLLVSLLGVLLVLTNGQLQQIFHMDYNAGDLLMLLAIVVWTLYSIAGRKMKGLPPIAATAASALIGLLLVAPFFFLSGGLSLPISAAAAWGIVYMGIFPSVGSFIFWNAALRQIGVSRAGIYLNLITVFTAILSLALGKPITIVQIAGGLLVFAGVYLTGRTAAQPVPEPDERK